MTPGSLLLAPRSSPVAVASACWAVYVENNGRWQMAAHQSGHSPVQGGMGTLSGWPVKYGLPRWAATLKGYRGMIVRIGGGKIVRIYGSGELFGSLFAL